MKNSAKKHNFVQKYKQVRNFVRLQFLFDDLTVDEYKKLGINESTYNQMKKILSAYIDDANVNITRVDGKKATALKNSMFSNGYNYLCNTFGMKNLVKSEVESFVLIMQLLAQTDGGDGSVDSSLIDAEASTSTPGGSDFDYYCSEMGIPKISNVYERLTELEQLGYLVRRQKGGFGSSEDDESASAFKMGYCPAQNPLREIGSVKDAVMLLDTLALMRNITQPYLCGNMLFETTLRYLRCINWDNAPFYETDDWDVSLITEYENPFLVADSHFEQVLDDEVLWQLMQAMYDGTAVSLTVSTSISSDEQLVSVYPLKLVTSAESGRRYLLAADTVTDMLSSYRLDKIVSVEAGKARFCYEDYRERLDEAKKHSMSGTVLLREDAQPAEVRLDFLPCILDEVRSLFPDCTITENDGIYTAVLLLNTTTELKPWLRRRIGVAAVQEGSALYDELMQEAVCWREMYGDI